MYKVDHRTQRIAVATSIAHDSHNIIVAGVNDGDMAVAVNVNRFTLV